MVPQINNRQEAETAVRGCYYPPLGNRGVAGTRNFGFGLTMSLDEYIPAANKNAICIIQIESREAVKNVESIASVPGIDCLFVGLSDLSVDLGVPGQMTHPDVEAALDKVIAAAKKHNLSVGIPVGDGKTAKSYIERGVSLLPAGVPAVEGEFISGDAIELVGPDMKVIARGLVAFDSEEIPQMLGRSTKELAASLGVEYERELVHRDDLVLL
jgi:2-keto-3-deoxy-L-rhamnonate aldolase RhmA